MRWNMLYPIDYIITTTSLSLAAAIQSKVGLDQRSEVVRGEFLLYTSHRLGQISVEEIAVEHYPNTVPLYVFKMKTQAHR